LGSSSSACEPPSSACCIWLDTWTGLGLVVGGIERQGLRFSLSHIGEGEWQAYFMASPMFAPAGFGVATTPWRAVQRPAWAAMKRTA
jgi:hypothetical protein